MIEIVVSHSCERNIFVDWIQSIFVLHIQTIFFGILTNFKIKDFVGI